MSTLNDNALCTRKDVKKFCEITGSNPDIDNLIIDLINRMSSHFELYCGRAFLADDYTEYCSGDNNRELFLYQRPVNSVTSIHIDSDWSWGSDTLQAANTYMIIDDLYVILKSGYKFPKGKKNIKVVYNAGYTSNSMPLDLKQACIEEVSRKYHRRRSIDETSKTLEDGSVSFVDLKFLPQTVQVLNKYINKAVL